MMAWQKKKKEKEVGDLLRTLAMVDFKCVNKPTITILVITWPIATQLFASDDFAQMAYFMMRFDKRL
jgi:hypothetical protein